MLFEDLWFVEIPSPMGECVGGWVGQWINGWGQVKSQKFNKSWPNRDNSILFEDLLFVETPPPMGGSMGSWEDGWFSGSMGGVRSFY